jgi:ATP/maltotriose-dependent transcriptional regulator MalT
LLAEDTQAARKWAAEAIAVSRELNLRGLEVMALAVDGTALVTEGDLENGTAELDEAAAAAIGGEVGEFMFIAFILCHLIYACEKARDYDRAVQWCQKAREFSDKMGFVFAQGTCRVYYAAVLVWRGKWREAEQELTDASGYLLKSRPPYEPEARVRLAELRRRQGRLEEAEALFREVDWHILASIGLAELSLEKGRLDDAEEYVQRVLRNLPPKSAAPRAAALELLVRIKAATGDHAGAQDVYRELELISQAFGTVPHMAVSTYLAGLLALASGHYEEARQRFDDAVVHFERTGGPFEAARARLDLATTLKHLGRTTRALEEAAAALRAFTNLGATGEAAKAEEVLRTLSAPVAGSLSPRSILTDRQIEILRLVAQGRSDREIAAQLVMSEHTVHRHVANILQRLDLSSRAAAVGYASRLGLL